MAHPLQEPCRSALLRQDRDELSPSFDKNTDHQRRPAITNPVGPKLFKRSIVGLTSLQANTQRGNTATSQRPVYLMLGSAGIDARASQHQVVHHAPRHQDQEESVVQHVIDQQPTPMRSRAPRTASRHRLPIISSSKSDSAVGRISFSCNGCQARP